MYILDVVYILCCIDGCTVRVSRHVLMAVVCSVVYDVCVGISPRVQCEGSLARDRYKSLQKRNIIEPRERVRYVCVYMLLAELNACRMAFFMWGFL